MDSYRPKGGDQLQHDGRKMHETNLTVVELTQSTSSEERVWGASLRDTRVTKREHLAFKMHGSAGDDTKRIGMLFERSCSSVKHENITFVIHSPIVFECQRETVTFIFHSLLNHSLRITKHSKQNHLDRTQVV